MVKGIFLILPLIAPEVLPYFLQAGGQLFISSRVGKAMG